MPAVGPMKTEKYEFSVAKCRALVRDLMEPKASRYWPDYTFGMIIGWSAFAYTHMNAWNSWEKWAAMTVAIFAMYRSALFIHELAHGVGKKLPGFLWFWNLTCGIIVMVPSFLFRRVHLDHHKSTVYGTKEDGEYFPIGTEEPYKIITYMLGVFIIPLLFLLRFAIGTPISFLIPALRPIVLERLSSLVVDYNYIRSKDSPAEIRERLWLEFFCFLWGATVLTSIVMGWVSTGLMLDVYIMFIGMFFFNSLRTLSAHRYLNEGRRMSPIEEVMDSVNLPEGYNALWAPVGLRFHGLHHFFPQMPYHNLGEAHFRLMKALPAGSPYHKTIETTLFSALGTLWRNASAATAKKRESRTATSH